MANLAEELYTLPDGWLPCDGCGRPMPVDKMNAHLGSSACQAEQHGSVPPSGWVEMGRVDHVNESDFRRAIAYRLPIFKQKPYHSNSDRRQIWWSPAWVKILNEANASPEAKRVALQRARLDYAYRAVVLAGLRLIGGEDDYAAVNDLFAMR